MTSESHKPSTQKLRLFLGFEIPQSLQNRLKELQTRLAPRLVNRLPAFRWMEPAAWHITALFLGHVPAELLPEIVRKVQQVTDITPAFTLKPRTLTWAPPSHNQRYRMLWVYFEESEPMETLVFALYHALARICPEVDKPRVPVYPHVTLARFGWTPLARLPSLEALGYHQPVPARELILWQSRLRPARNETRYLPLHRFQLSAPAQHPA